MSYHLAERGSMNKKERIEKAETAVHKAYIAKLNFQDKLARAEERYRIAKAKANKAKEAPHDLP